MQRFLNNFFLRKTDSRVFWVITAFIFKGLIFAFLLYRHDYNTIPGFWGGTGGDTPSYLLPIENLIKTGHYTPDLRMPGYGILYFPFAYLFTKAAACNLLIILQYIVSALTVYPLALIALHLFKSDKAFYLTFYLYAISTYTSLFDDMLYSESFTVSFLILSVFFLLKSFQPETRHERVYLFLSGLFFTETFFLRPVFIPLIAVYVTVLVLHSVRLRSKKNLMLRLLILVSPVLFFDGVWIARNYAIYHRVIPTMKSIYSPEIENSYQGPLNTFVKSWGGSEVYWDPRADIRWFMPESALAMPHPIQSKAITLPDYICTSKFNLDSLQLLKRQLSLYLATGTDSIKDSLRRKALLATVRAKCKRYTQSVKQEKPFLYYIAAPLILTKKFLIHSGTYNLFNVPAARLGTWLLAVKIFYSGLYLFILAFGAAAVLILAKPSLQCFPVALITSIVIYTVIVHPILLGKCEARYFVPAYPFMLVCAVYMVSLAASRFYKFKSEDTLQGKV